MTITNTTLGMNQKTTTYGPLDYGSHAGEPVVDFSVSKSDVNQMPVRSIESLFENNNWKRSVKSGFARLQFNAQNIFDEEYNEGIEELARILDATFVDFEVSKNELQTFPNREIKNIADYYRVFVPSDREFDEEVMKFFAEQSNKYGNVDFIFKVDDYGDEKYVSSVVRDYKIYDSDVWLFPKGRKAKTVSERMEYAIRFAKSNSWNVSPRISILLNASEEFED